MKNKDKNCKGCQGICYDCSTYINIEGYTIVCPCVMCLVKVICGSICESFSNFVLARDRLWRDL